MKASLQGAFLAALILLFSAGQSFGVVDQFVQVQGTNLVLSWPSLGYESYLIQYRPTLDPSTPWQELTNAYPANSTNRSTFTIPCCALVALGGGSSMMSLSGGGASGAAQRFVESETADSGWWAMPADGSGVAVPFVLYPPGFDTKDLIMVEGPELPVKVQKFSGQAGEAFENGSSAAMLISNGGCDCPDIGFFRVFHIPDFPAGITNFTFDGPVFIPVDFKDYMDRVENLVVLLDGEDTHLSEFTSAYYNSKTNWGMGVYFDRLANGTHQIQLRSTIRLTDDISGDTPMLVTSNLTRSIVVDNAITFTNWDDLVWNNTNYTVRAQLKVSQADWWIDIYDAWGEYINGTSGHTTNGLISWTWNLRDTDGNLRDSLENDPFFEPYIMFEATAPGPPAAAATKPTPIPMIAYPSQGQWIVTFQNTFYEPGTTGGGYYNDAMDAVAGGPALRGIPVSKIPLKYGTNSYTQSQRDDSWAVLKGNMFSRENRNLYYFGHGWASGIGGDQHTYGTNGNVTGGMNFRSSKAFLTSKQVQDEITYNKYGGARPYRFVWLDGCSTANGDWPGAFGVNKATNGLSYYTNSVTNPSHKRPSAFVGWNQTIGGEGWGTLQNFMLCRSQWMFDWQQNWTFRALTDALENGRANTGWIPFNQFWSAMRVYGFNDLRMNQYNQKNDWPGP